MNVEHVYKFTAFCARHDQWSELTGKFQAFIKLAVRPHVLRIDFLLLFLERLQAESLSESVMLLLFLGICPEDLLCLCLGAKNTIGESKHFAWINAQQFYDAY